MKPLIVSFFAAILCYSVFVDDDVKAKSEIAPKVRSIRSNIPDTIHKTDTAIFYANKHLSPVNHTYVADFDKPVTTGIFQVRDISN